MKKRCLLLLVAAFALPALGQSADAASSREAGLAGLLMLVGQFLLVVVAVMLALAWIWFPFMVKRRLDKIIHKLDSIEQLQAKSCAAPPSSS
jgi:hypothetical protein